MNNLEINESAETNNYSKIFIEFHRILKLSQVDKAFLIIINTIDRF